MVPLARALEAAGHQVAVATDPAFCGYVRDAGFEAHPAGLDHPDAQARFIAATPAWAETPPQDRMPLQFPGLFAGVRAPAMLRDLQPLIATWRPDLVIHETAELAGAIAAEAAGVAHVEHSFGILRPAIVREVAVEILAPIADRLGVTEPRHQRIQRRALPRHLPARDPAARDRGRPQRPAPQAGGLRCRSGRGPPGLGRGPAGTADDLRHDGHGLQQVGRGLRDRARGPSR